MSKTLIFFVALLPALTSVNAFSFSSLTNNNHALNTATITTATTTTTTTARCGSLCRFTNTAAAAGGGGGGGGAAVTTTTVLRASPKNEYDDFGNSDFPMEEQTGESSSIDWDGELKKLLEKEKAGTRTSRPDPGYKSDAELAAIRAANKAQKEVAKLGDKLPSVPSVNLSSLTGDWKFWIGILAIISIGSAVLSAPTSYQPLTGGDSYYI